MENSIEANLLRGSANVSLNFKGYRISIALNSGNVTDFKAIHKSICILDENDKNVTEKFIDKKYLTEIAPNDMELFDANTDFLFYIMNRISIEEMMAIDHNK